MATLPLFAACGQPAAPPAAPAKPADTKPAAPAATAAPPVAAPAATTAPAAAKPAEAAKPAATAPAPAQAAPTQAAPASTSSRPTGTLKLLPWQAPTILNPHLSSGTRDYIKVVFVTSINSLRQKEQAIVKDGWQKLGVETEIKSVDAGVFFSSDPANPDIYARFSADVLMLSSSPDSPFPVQYMSRFHTGKDPGRTWAQKANNWSGRNFMKWTNDDYDKLFDQVLVESDLAKASEMWQKLNELVIKEYASVPLVDRTFSSGKSKQLTGPAPRTFDSETWNIAEWKKG